ncbi:hypothetical protein J6590_007159 [Homalodisca vitripennis]|nr:hypothetical protein J6590_007159 [Homalodisca vitripennis]
MYNSRVAREVNIRASLSTVLPNQNSIGSEQRPCGGSNDQGLKVTSKPPPMAGLAVACKDRSAVTHPSSSHARRCLIQLSRDNRYTPYTAPLDDLASMNFFVFPYIKKLRDQ